MAPGIYVANTGFRSNSALPALLEREIPAPDAAPDVDAETCDPSRELAYIR